VVLLPFSYAPRAALLAVADLVLVRRRYAHTKNIHAMNNHQIRRTK
jgi:hypothetical protein